MKTADSKNAPHHRSGHWRPLAKIQIAGENIFIGPGCRQLLQMIDSTGSVKQACWQIGMSYSKAWKIIRNAENELGYEIVSRKHGGKDGGNSYLTPKGTELLAWFEEFEKKCTDAVNKIFTQYYQDRPNA